MNKHPIALQLYSLRELAGQDFVAALELAAGLGYEGVEFAGYGSLPSEEMKDHLARLNLQAVSSHVSFERLQEHLEEEITYNRVLGNRTLVCPVPPQGFDQSSAENWRRFAKDLSEIGKRVADQGFRLGYHNHSFEFVLLDGSYALDHFFAAVDPQSVFAQLDLGWILHGGENPVGYLRKYAGRTPLVHIKDFDGENRQTDVGYGRLDLPTVLKTTLDTGVEWLILETEVYKISPPESIRAGLASLRRAQNDQ